MSAGPEKPMWPVAVLLVAAALLAVTSTSSFGGKMMAQTAMAQAKTEPAGPGPWDIKAFLDLQYLGELLSTDNLDVWFCSLVGSIAVGLSGVFPLLVIPIEAGTTLKTEGKSHFDPCVCGCGVACMCVYVPHCNRSFRIKLHSDCVRYKYSIMIL